MISHAASLLIISLFYLFAAVAMSTFTPLKSSRVAVIGGGISGLSCASRLVGSGLDVVVFDTGKREVGGRVSSRKYSIGDDNYLTLDHSTQLIGRPKTLEFTEFLLKMQRNGFVHRWDGPLGLLRNGDFFGINSNEGDSSSDVANAYCGVNGMNTIAKYLAEDIHVERPIWVSKMKRIESSVGSGHWELFEYQKPLGKFDYIIIAHNGKCADRLLSTANVPNIHNLLKVKFGPRLPSPPSRASKMQLCSLWVASVIFKRSVDVEYEGAVVSDNNVLSWVCNTTKKLKQQSNSAAGGGKEVWTLISTRDFGASNKVPQENIPAEKYSQVQRLMLDGFSSATGIAVDKLPEVDDIILQLWGAAVPLNQYSSPFVMNGKMGVGICGDWFSPFPSARPSVESAFMSGNLLGDYISDAIKSNHPLQDFGLEKTHNFTASEGHPLGDLSSLIKDDVYQEPPPPLKSSSFKQRTVKGSNDRPKTSAKRRVWTSKKNLAESNFKT